MTFRRGIFGMMALCFTASSVLADEVLYCADTAATGYHWDQGKAASVTVFTAQRFTIKVVTASERIITPTSGDTAGFPSSYQCHAEPEGAQIVCNSILGGDPWVFSGSSYTRAFLFGPPAGGGDPNIVVAYGTCTKF